MTPPEPNHIDIYIGEPFNFVGNRLQRRSVLSLIP